MDRRSIGKDEFRSRFFKVLENKGVGEVARPYYLKHLELWGVYLRGRSGERRSTLVGQWILELGRNPAFEEYQIRQAARAVRLKNRERD